MLASQAPVAGGIELGEVNLAGNDTGVGSARVGANDGSQIEINDNSVQLDEVLPQAINRAQGGIEIINQNANDLPGIEEVKEEEAADDESYYVSVYSNQSEVDN